MKYKIEFCKLKLLISACVLMQASMLPRMRSRKVKFKECSCKLAPSSRNCFKSVIFKLNAKVLRTPDAMEAIEQQLDDLIKDCIKQGFTNKQMSKIFATAKKQRSWQKFMRFLVLSSLLFVTVTLAYKCATINWTMSAIGRLALIHILPYWDWTPYYNARCLIQKETRSQISTSTKTSMGRFETEPENCMLCERVDFIAAISNVTFSQLESTYLERGLPVIVTDSHSPKKLVDLLDTLQNEAEDFLDSQSCDLATNIMLKKLFNLDVALQKIQLGQVAAKWFLQLRNCQTKAVKSSRVFVTRPYYYPLHMEPFYTSWLLMSHDYQLEPQRLYLKGLIFVQQLSASFDIQLQPKQPCNETCPVINIKLNSGECLVFSTDLWIFHYSFKDTNTNATAIATILEIDWQF